MTLYTSRTSYAHRTRIVLSEKHIPYETIEVDLKHKPEDLVKQNPYGKVPVLVDDDGVIYESAIINEYLDEKFADIPLMPRHQLDRAKVRIWVDFFNTRVHPTGSDLQKDRDPEKARARMAQHLRTLDDAQRSMMGSVSVLAGCLASGRGTVCGQVLRQTASQHFVEMAFGVFAFLDRMSPVRIGEDEELLVVCDEFVDEDFTVLVVAIRPEKLPTEAPARRRNHGCWRKVHAGLIPAVGA